jgi:hypothetical protein
MKRVAQLLLVAMMCFCAGIATGAGLLLTNELPLSAISIDMRTGTFKYKLRDLTPIPTIPGKS